MAKKMDLSFVKVVSDMRGFQSHVLDNTDALVIVGACRPASDSARRTDQERRMQAERPCPAGHTGPSRWC
eukprot:scaffold17457_cov105-Isochrysis_galbana.AAC.20